jgi:hypothetical protein
LLQIFYIPAIPAIPAIQKIFSFSLVFRLSLSYLMFITLTEEIKMNEQAQQALTDLFYKSLENMEAFKRLNILAHKVFNKTKSNEKTLEVIKYFGENSHLLQNEAFEILTQI